MKYTTLMVFLSLTSAIALADPNTPIDKTNAQSFEINDQVFVISAMSIPYLKFYADKDGDEVNNGIEFDANLNTGSGYAISIGLGNSDTNDGLGSSLSSIGLTYMTTRHTETQSVQRARMDALFLEGSIKFGQGERLYTNLGAGVGGIVFDLPEGYKSADGIAGLLRLDIGIELVEHVMVQIGGGLFRWGHPGETYGNGAFLEVGGAWYF